MKEKALPDPNQKYPIPGYEREIYVKPTIQNPNIIVGDFTYITDANYISEAEKEKVRGSKVIVLNALRQEPHISHFSLQEAVELLEDLQPERAYLTHISHLLGLHREVEQTLPDFIRLGYDGLQLQV